jgi:hypothetical protein
VALAFAALIAIVAFAIFLMWGMPSIFRRPDEDRAGENSSAGGPAGWGGGGHGGGGNH